MAIAQALLAGFLLSCAFPPFSLWWVAPIAIVCLLQSLERKPLKQRTALVALFGASFFAPLLHWTSTYVGSIPWLLLVFGQTLLLLPLALLPTNNYRKIILFPALWVFIEVIRTHFPFGGFGWGRIGFSQSDSPYSQFASIAGPSGLTFIVCAISISLFFWIKQEGFLAVSSALMVALLLGASTVAEHRIPAIVPSEHISILAVQGGVPQLGLNFNERATAVFTNHLKVTQEYFLRHKRNIDLIVWPENSVDVDPYSDLYVRNSLQSLVDDIHIPIIIGAVLQTPYGPQNASILWKPQVGPTSTYIKMHLTPFGEYMPLRSVAQLLSPFAKNVVDFIPGKKAVVHIVGRAKVSPVICFELVDDQLGRSINALGNLMLVQTNSATFGLSAESAQELEITRIRAIEHQRFAVSIATSGISAIIDNEGAILQKSAQNDAEVLTYDLPLMTTRSISDRLGNSAEILIILVPIALYFLLPFLEWKLRRIKRRSCQ